MKFHNVDMRGKLKIQRVSGLPTWQAVDEGRILYDEDTDTMYVGTAFGWSSAGATILSTLPTYTSGDEGRVVYAEDEEKLYYADSGEWKELSVGGGYGIRSYSTLSAAPTGIEGLVVYAEDEEILYYRDANEWKEVGTGGGYTTVVNSWSPSGDDYVSTVTHSLGTSGISWSCFNNSNNESIVPKKVKLIDNNTLEVYMPVNTVNLKITVAG
jgi:hypothetical protein